MLSSNQKLLLLQVDRAHMFSLIETKPWAFKKKERESRVLAFCRCRRFGRCGLKPFRALYNESIFRKHRGLLSCDYYNIDRRQRYRYLIYIYVNIYEHFLAHLFSLSLSRQHSKACFSALSDNSLARFFSLSRT